MLCENCKANQATTYLKTVINGETKELRLCGECANNLNSFSLLVSGFGLNGILSSLMDKNTGSEKKPGTRLTCPVCGSSLLDISESGRVGCANCYDAFYESLTPYIRRIHGSAIHVGRAPKRIAESPARRIKALEIKLAKAVAEQEYERAAVIRDELNVLREGDGK